METYPMELRLEPRDGRVAFRVADPAHAEPLQMDAETVQLWHEFFWSPVTGWLDRRTLTDEQVAAWIPLHIETDPARRRVEDVLVKPEERKVAVRIPSHADHSGPADGHPDYRWLVWWLSEAGLTVELLTEEKVGDWVPVYVEEETDG